MVEVLLVIFFIFHFHYLSSKEFAMKCETYSRILQYIVHYPTYKIYRQKPEAIPLCVRRAYDDEKVQKAMLLIGSLTTEEKMRLLASHESFYRGFDSSLEKEFPHIFSLEDLPSLGNTSDFKHKFLINTINNHLELIEEA